MSQPERSSDAIAGSRPCSSAAESWRAATLPCCSWAKPAGQGSGRARDSREIVAPRRPVLARQQRRAAPELMDSELFGHEKGAFTGASSRRKGWFEQAHTGTLFLDEVGELTPAAQVRLLRVVQDGELQRVGGEQPIKVDVRIVAATHRDLPMLIAAHRFREDLYYRLAVFPIVIPPLRDRVEDIGPMAEYIRGPRRPAVRVAAVTPDRAGREPAAKLRLAGQRTGTVRGHRSRGAIGRRGCPANRHRARQAGDVRTHPQTRRSPRG